jgi:hypothetical protein
MNAKIRRMMQEIERRGGRLHVNPSLPDELSEQFLEQVLACPDCCEEAATPRDVLANVTIPPRFTGQ